MQAHWTLGRIGTALLGTTLLVGACRLPPQADFERGDAFAAVGFQFET